MSIKHFPAGISVLLVALFFTFAASLNMYAGAAHVNAEKNAPVLSARILFHMDEKKLNERAIFASSVGEAIGAFYKTHAKFALKDFEKIQIPSTSGKLYKITDLGELEVVFEQQGSN